PMTSAAGERWQHLDDRSICKSLLLVVDHESIYQHGRGGQDARERVAVCPGEPRDEIRNGGRLGVFLVATGGRCGAGVIANADVRHAQPPIADIGRSGCTNPGSSIPCPARLPAIAAHQAFAMSSSVA